MRQAGTHIASSAETTLVMPRHVSAQQQRQISHLGQAFQPRPAASKSSWRELVGVKGQIAATTIERENPLVHAHVVPEGSYIIHDFRCDRVWVWVDSNGIVTREPRIG
ncbi:Inhibitor of trypsin and hageman factor [Cinnamomum micranthum f. kanehirae]|uniref:Inhibitor of trypsin and hageman factor n=1 Tax=Cinnamomum micranthum f. kanehirae TaxID=337451 RepID=A0A3S3MJ44_9MAGN|nr:Inhibitor of trypsin and hageman factor [Cinnamomum micranthum f. kanehirae]